MIIERFNIFKNKEEKYFLILHRPNEGDYSILYKLTHGIEDFITTDEINSSNSIMQASSFTGGAFLYPFFLTCFPDSLTVFSDQVFLTLCAYLDRFSKREKEFYD